MKPGPVVEIDFTGRDDHITRRRFTRPVQVIKATEIDEVRPALKAAERATLDGYYAVGYISYEAAPAFDPTLDVHTANRLPLLWFGIFDDEEPEPHHSTADDPRVEVPTAAIPWKPSTPRTEYDEAIASIRCAIEEGELGQVNHTFRLRAPLHRVGPGLYDRLLEAQGPAYGAYFDLGRYRIVSASPELFFSREGEEITVRPMKGTARRGRWAEEDREMIAQLAASPKDRAENRMIVDLMTKELRNVAHHDSVRLVEFCKVEHYRTVHQMTSTVTARLQPATTLDEIFESLFPCGSVTGTPKAPAMKKIAELETTPREVYCGAIGLIRPGGDCTFNVAIRTLWADTITGEAEYSVGGAITRDSTAEDEYDEAIAKAALLEREWPDFEILETIRLEDGVFARLERHLDRMRESAEYFDFPDPTARARALLAQHAKAYPGETRRVRALASSKGQVSVESIPMTQRTSPHRCAAQAESARGEPGHDPSVGGVNVLCTVLALEPVDRYDPFLCHKTTHREVYERQMDTARRAWSEERRGEGPSAAAEELFDVLLWNHDKELTEFTRGNLVLEVDGERWTPPRSSGLLIGCYRAELIERGEITERVLYTRDLERATRAWFINSLREWVPVRVDRVRVSRTEPAPMGEEVFA